MREILDELVLHACDIASGPLSRGQFSPGPQSERGPNHKNRFNLSGEPCLL